MDEERHRTEELKAEQDEREKREREQAEEEPSDDGAAVHERRAEKHAYLKEKLAERAESERDSE